MAQLGYVEHYIYSHDYSMWTRIHQTYVYRTLKWKIHWVFNKLSIEKEHHMRKHRKHKTSNIIVKSWKTIKPPGGKLYTIFFTHLKLCLATATHNFKCVKSIHIYLIRNQTNIDV